MQDVTPRTGLDRAFYPVMQSLDKLTILTNTKQKITVHQKIEVKDLSRETKGYYKFASYSDGKIKQWGIQFDPFQGQENE